MSQAWEWLENPVLVKCLRSGLRPARVITPIGLTIMGAVVVMWGNHMINPNAWWTSLFLLMLAQAIILVLRAPTAVATVTAAAANSGMMDFHRIAPLAPARVAVGFLIGGAALEYALAGVLVPMVLVAAFLAGANAFDMLLGMFIVATNALMFQAIAQATTLMSEKPGQYGKGTWIAWAAYVFSFNIPVSGGIALFTATPLLREVLGPMMNMGPPGAPLLPPNPPPPFFGWPVPLGLQSLLFQGPAFAMALAVSTRKIRAERLPPFSKGMALISLLLVDFWLLGATWSLAAPGMFGNPPVQAAVPAALWPGVVYATVVTGIIMVTAMALLGLVTPDATELARGQRRAIRTGRRPAPWDDLAPSIAVMIVMGVTLMLSAGLAWFARHGFAEPPFALIAVVLAALITLCHFGLALQFIVLRFGRNLFMMYFVLVWLMPFAVSIILAAGPQPQGAFAAAAFSPLTSLAVALLPAAGPEATMIGWCVNSFWMLLFAYGTHHELRRRRRAFEAALRPATARPDIGPESTALT